MVTEGIFSNKNLYLFGKKELLRTENNIKSGSRSIGKQAATTNGK